MKNKHFFSPSNSKLVDTIWDLTLTPLLNPLGEIDFLLLISRNITEQIKDKERLYESEERYRSIFENSLDGILLATVDGTILSANPSSCRMLGRNEADMCRVGRKGIIDLDDPKLSKAIAIREETGNFSSELTMVRKDGTKFPADVTSKLFKNRKGNILTSIIIRDLSEHKQAEGALRFSEAKFSQTFYNNQAMMAIVKAGDSTFIDINNAALSAFGYRAEEIIGKSLFELNLWVDTEEREEMLRRIQKTGTVKDFACKFRRKSNETVYMLCTANYINIGEENCILVSALDITSHKKAEEALRLSEELFHKTFNVNPIAMLILSPECNKILKVNESFRKITESNHMIKEFPELEENKEIWVDINERAAFLTEILREGIVRNHEVKFRKKSGDVAVVLLSGVFINWKKEKCILLAVNDITELRNFQSKLAWLDRLRLIGVTSAGIAHEIRNPLTTVKGFLQLFKEKERYIDDRERLQLMIEEIEKANAIITEFLSLASNNADNLKRQNLNAIIKEFLPLLQEEAQKSNKFIEIKLEEICELMLDKEDMRTLISNLVNNGLDAMLPGGYITIKTFMHCNKVTMAIVDQGKGIHPEYIDKIGMPFFTTKDHGTGLGLAMCYNIANRNNGKIEVETGDKGTVFRVIFTLGEESSYLVD